MHQYQEAYMGWRADRCYVRHHHNMEDYCRHHPTRISLLLVFLARTWERIGSGKIIFMQSLKWDIAFWRVCPRLPWTYHPAAFSLSSWRSVSMVKKSAQVNLRPLMRWKVSICAGGTWNKQPAMIVCVNLVSFLEKWPRYFCVSSLFYCNVDLRVCSNFFWAKQSNLTWSSFLVQPFPKEETVGTPWNIFVTQNNTCTDELIQYGDFECM